MADEADSWAEARAYRDEHEHLTVATGHVARAVAELTHAMGLIGDHSSALPLREALENLQMLQAQLATASEKALSMGRMAARRAQHEQIQRQVDQSSGWPEAMGPNT